MKSFFCIDPASCVFLSAEASRSWKSRGMFGCWQSEAIASLWAGICLERDSCTRGPGPTPSPSDGGVRGCEHVVGEHVREAQVSRVLSIHCPHAACACEAGVTVEQSHLPSSPMCPCDLAWVLALPPSWPSPSCWGQPGHATPCPLRRLAMCRASGPKQGAWGTGLPWPRPAAPRATPAQRLLRGGLYPSQPATGGRAANRAPLEGSVHLGWR